MSVLLKVLKSNAKNKGLGHSRRAPFWVLWGPDKAVLISALEGSDLFDCKGKTLTLFH